MSIHGIRHRSLTQQESLYLTGARAPAAKLVRVFCKVVGIITSAYCAVGAVASVLHIIHAGGSIIAPAIWVIFGAAILLGTRVLLRHTKQYANAVQAGRLAAADGICLGVTERASAYHRVNGALPDRRWRYMMDVQIPGAQGDVVAQISPATYQRAVEGEPVLVVSTNYFRSGENLQAHLRRDVEHRKHSVKY